MRLNLARFVFSQSCSLFLSVVSFRLRIISLMLSLSAATSPCASTVIERVRSPLVTAVATSAMARTCVVRLAASWLTLSVRSFHVPAAPGTLAWPPSLPSTPTSRATVVTWSANVASVSIMPLIVSASAAISPFASTVSFCFRSPLATAVTTLAMPRTWLGQVAGHEVHVVGQVLPRAGDALHLGLAAELAFGADLAGHARHFGGERAELIHHRVDGVLELEDLALHVDGDLLRQVAVGDGLGHVGDVADLAGEVAGHEVHVVGEVLPRAGDAGHVGLAAELAFGADFARHARHFGGERAELIDHRVDGVLQLEDLALHVDGDLLRQVAVGHGRGHVGDVAHLAGEVAGHEVHVVGQVLPRAGDALHVGLAAELAFGADLAGHARHFRRRTSGADRPSC